MNRSLLPIATLLFTTGFLVGCGQDEPVTTKPSSEPQRMVEKPSKPGYVDPSPTVVPKETAMTEIPEPESVSIVDDIEPIATPEDDLPGEPESIMDETNAFGLTAEETREFLTRVTSATASVGENLPNGGRKPSLTLDTSSCLSDAPGAYRLCATKMVRDNGFENATLYKNVPHDDHTRYHDMYTNK